MKLTAREAYEIASADELETCLEIIKETAENQEFEVEIEGPLKEETTQSLENLGYTIKENKDDVIVKWRKPKEPKKVAIQSIRIV